MLEYRENRWKNVASNPASRLTDRIPAFISDLSVEEPGPGRAIVEIADSFRKLIATRLERAPDKTKLAFLDAIGVEPIPPQPARCPVVFEMTPGTVHARAPERTQLGAASDETTIIFETESAIGLAASRLGEIVAVLPNNRFVDHTLDVVGEKPFVLFEANQPIPQEMYLAHDRFFAVTAGSTIELQWELTRTSASDDSPWTIQWEYWDGDGWTLFAPFQRTNSKTHRCEQVTAESSVLEDDGYSEDGTLDMARSGTMRLRASGKPAQQKTIRGTKSYWIRASIVPIDKNRANEGKSIPMVDRVQARNINTVNGFEFRKSSASLPIDGIANRTLRIRLTDDSGAPLLTVQPPVVGSTFGYSLNILNRAPIAGERADVKIDETGLFIVKSPTLRTVSIRVSWGPINASGQLVGRAIHTWDLPEIRNLEVDRSYDIDVARCGRLPTIAFGCGINIDPTAPFQPFGPSPQPGATFLFACPEVLNKSGARVTLFTEVMSEFKAALSSTKSPIVRWEYWNGIVWAPLPDQRVEPKQFVNEVLSFAQSGEIQFTVPSNIAVKQELGQEQLWVRVHLAEGSYLVKNGGSASVGSNGEPQSESLKSQIVQFDKVFPPVVGKFRLEYEYASPAEPAVGCLTFNDFHWADQTSAAAFGGNAFVPFVKAEEVRPSLYLGFTRALPTDLISLFVNVNSFQAASDLSWEYHDGNDWRRLVLESDETDGFSRPGIVRFVWPGTPYLPDPEPLMVAEGRTLTFVDSRLAARFRSGDRVALFQDDQAETASVAETSQGTLTLTVPLENKFSTAVAGRSPLPRFGRPRHWVRIVWTQTALPISGDRGAIHVSGIYLNATMARETNSVTNELVGSSSEIIGESFDLRNRPVLRGERVEILELDGALANSGWPILLDELRRSGRPTPDKDLTLERDSKTGNVNRAWVRWESRPNFAGSNSDDRHYVLERISGRLQFGDGQAGRVPPANPNNVRVSYQSGGGRRGNVAAHAVRVLMGATAAQNVFNPIAASGGADAEMMSKDPQTGIDSILDRGPQLIRHRHRAITVQDYEQLARAASPEVAAVRVITAEDTRGLVRAGTIRVVVLPQADERDPEPKPSQELIRVVKNFLQSRAPANVAGRIFVESPVYFRVGVEAILVPSAPDSAGQLFRLSVSAIATFLHPVVGGRSQRGWGFGQAIHRSDLVKYLHDDTELKPHLAFVQELRLLDSGVAMPESISIPMGQVPCSGAIRVIVASDTEVCR